MRLSDTGYEEHRLHPDRAVRRQAFEGLETALRRLLQSRPESGELPPLPSFDSGGALVDVADREALYRAMEGR